MANEKKRDRRTLYTRKAIQDAFLRVKRKKEYNAITVTDICREAEISRGTFYAHFNNIAEVLNALLDDALVGMDYLREYISAPQSDAKCAHPFCRFVRENTELHCIMFDDALGHIVVKKIATIYKDVYMQEIRNKGAGLTDQENGEGCFYQLKDRSWVHQITLGRKEDGTLERKSFKGKTKQICIERKEEWLAEREAQKHQEELQGSEELYREQQRLKLGHSLESEEFFAEAFMGWLRLYKSPPARKPSTYASYIDTYNLHFAPEFGEMPLYMITQDVVQDYYQRKQLNGARSDGKEGGLSPKTIRNHHMILKDFFAYAEKKYKLDCNPTLDTTRPEVVTPEMRVLSPDEMEIFISEVMKET